MVFFYRPSRYRSLQKINNIIDKKALSIKKVESKWETNGKCLILKVFFFTETKRKFQFRDKQKRIVHLSFLFVSEPEFFACLIYILSHTLLIIVLMAASPSSTEGTLICLTETNRKFQNRDKQKMAIVFSFLFVSKSLFSVCLIMLNS